MKGLPPALDLPAWGKAECAVTCASAPELSPDAASLDIAGTFDGRRITRFSAPLASIRIDGNPCGTQVNFWIQNVRLYRARPVSGKNSPK